MNNTYEEILTDMKNAYFEKSGENVEKYGEMSLRFEAVASEIYSLYCFCDFVIKQAFPQTAQGEYLDMHAQMRGIKRKEAQKARVKLRFYLSEPSESDTQIKKGCVCSVKSRPFVQFESDEDVTIPAGNLSAETTATAVQTGASYNVKAGEISVIVNPPLGVVRVENSAPFVFGEDNESDAMLKRRTVSSYGSVSSGFSFSSAREAILSIDGVTDCLVTRTDGGVLACVRTNSESLSDKLREKVEEKLYFVTFSGKTVNVIAAKRKNYTLCIFADCEKAEFDSVKGEIEARVKDSLSSLKISESVKLADAEYTASFASGGLRCEASSPQSEEDMIPCGENEYLNLEKLEVKRSE